MITIELSFQQLRVILWALCCLTDSVDLIDIEIMAIDQLKQILLDGQSKAYEEWEQSLPKNNGGQNGF